MMEVLDNCPHDRVHKRQSSGEWQQTHVLEDAFEVFDMTWSLSLLQLPNQGTETMLPVKYTGWSGDSEHYVITEGRCTL